MSDNKRPLVLWSGGLDSTFLMWHLLQTSDVDYTYIVGGQRLAKQDREDQARKAALKYFHEHAPFKANYVDPKVEANISNMGQLTWSQPALWLIGALGAVDHTQHSSVQAAYVLGDEILAMQEFLQQTWYGLQGLSKQGMVPLYLPLRMMSKYYILNMIPKALYDCVWYCETPDDDEPCGRCMSCITHLVELHRLTLARTEIGCHANQQQLYNFNNPPAYRIPVYGPHPHTLRAGDFTVYDALDKPGV